MKMRHVSALAVLLAAGCAHGQKGDPQQPPSAAGLRDENGAQVARGDREVNEPRAVSEEQSGDHVAVPGHQNRDHLATTGGDLPSSEAKKTDPAAPASAASFGTSADNTRVNERDRESAALTPMDQSESESDRDLVQRIRKAVIADDTLSFTAKNVKIITRDGQVTLRGAVNNAREKATIEKAARDAAGPKRVTNELEVAN